MNEKEIFEKFKYMFKLRDCTTPPFHPIVWGMECDSGWHELIYNMLEKIDAVDSSKKLSVTQIKEKFGTLRFYFDYTGSEEDERKIWNIVSEAENESSHTCELCGCDKATTSKMRGWYKTLCEQCRITEEKGENQDA